MNKPEVEGGESPKWVTTYQAAKQLGVAVRTIQLWVESGVLPAARTPGGHRRIPLDAMADFTARTGLGKGPVDEKPAVEAVAQPRGPRPTILVVESDPDQLSLWGDDAARSSATRSRCRPRAAATTR